MSDDEDSLFGSPPPSPQAGALALPRSSTEGSRPSTSTAPVTQNVGTIALPGSHPDSELPMNPLALSLNHGIVQWPPAHIQTQTQSAHAHIHAASSSYAHASYTPSCSGSTPSTSSTRASTPRAPAPPKKKKRRKEKEATPPPPEPQFILPDPSEPPPANFLRNQENLLGRAGRVGGVKPASITHTRGTTSSNPILIEDDDERDTPILGRRTREKSSQPYIDPSLLSAPTNQEIVQVLIGQKDIFPILEGVLKLVMRSATAPANPQHPAPVRTGFERGPPPPPPPAPPAKKRKLNRVPAGAADWDVPFPFQDGDGPKSYQNTWERERGKRLISELIKLIKTAARKAATKKYLQEQDARRRESEEPQSSTASSIFGNTSTFPPWLCAKRPTTTSTNVLQDASNSVIPSASVSTPNTSATTTTTTTTCPTTAAPTPPPETSDTAFHQLMASLNEAIPNSEHTSVNPLYVSKPPEADTNTTAISGVDQPIFDTWMSFLETFPMSFNGTPSSATSLFGDQTSFSSSSQSECSTPGIGIGELSAETLQALDAAAGSMNFTQASEEYDAMIASIFGVGDSAQASGPGAGAPPPPNPNSIPFDESLIDPSLMGLSMQPSASTTSTANTTGTTMVTDDFDFSALFMDNNGGGGSGSGVGTDLGMSHLQVHAEAHAQSQQAPSPVASTSSMGNNDPSTPASAVWDLSAPEVFMGDIGGAGIGMGGLNLDPAATTDWNPSALGLPSDFGEIGEMGESRQRVDKGKGKQRAVEVEPPSEPGITPTPTSSSSLPPGEIPIPPAESIISALLQAPTGTSLGSSLFVPKPVVFHPARNLKKDEVVKRAQERRKQLKEELDGVKMRLWETTVEQAGIMTLMRRMDEAAQVKARAEDQAQDQERTGGMSVSGPGESG